ncbi:MULTISPECIES: 3-hydroxyacyl-CoA dehydrogenase NAD-binding domain-containing protein [unclassified Ensifer]|uniref:3-hydroxyacyl-CoA dehydrogenase NAD-binding domain-containing protein n=1 Tax=unclassified Ensifer TaxID=2633371 RepID=UPI000812CA17|nr:MULTISPECIES: 3-hydroxyacyl-CoA dehydrogenase NAD-binding domain-containing protein [unclassified Ensifer]OCP10068.1 3-hydroxyacyl-CoA dehydrogenase [Ensifer sp. LC14]OCP12269.1 3-hydroxyacyl-CoA dehydrogenase [Ensifer sp. LC13]OCP13085.1 3-hydroxyacyl-CoA dehydrogenase [Ensifer sp. LC11]OCP33830.1 3-hydroxyacyl-CoA dehydrogenase [Ensifer sp. LC499]
MSEIQFSESVSAGLEDGVLVVTIDNPPVNALSAHVRAGLRAALDHAAGLPAIKGVIVTGAGSTFIGGADIKEFGRPPVEPTLPDVIERIETSDKPVISAVNGAALGGGCEVALACHGRIAGEKASFGLPEVKLGLVPGAGGTQRLPRLIGLIAAIDLIGTGRAVKTAEAVTLGLADGIAKDPIAAALAFIRKHAGKPLRRTGMIAAPSADSAAFDAEAAKVLARARGQYAPGEAIRLVKAAGELTLQQGLAEERATFLRLRDSAQSAALRHVFFAERSAGKVEGLDTASARRIETVGVVGTGLMGSGIAVSALTSGYRLVALEQTQEAAASGRARITETLDKAVRSGRLTAAGRDDCDARLQTTAEAGDLAAADLVIEAVFDDLQVKTDLFRKLDGIVAPGAILATNTSYLDPDAIAAATADPSRMVGLHFFSPANVMRLVEVVECAKTAPEVLASALAFVKRLGKLPIVCGVTEGFIGNRIFSAYRREAEFMLEDGALPQEIDAALEAYGFPMGIFAVNDMAGLEIAWARRKRQAATRDPAARYVEIADRLCEAGRLGRKNGRGWYAYPNGERTVDSEVTAIIEAERTTKKITPRTFAAEEIMGRLLKAMVDEGRALLAEGIAARASDIDLVMINGYGFPAHKGGPMFAAEQGKDLTA